MTSKPKFHLQKVGSLRFAGGMGTMTAFARQRKFFAARRNCLKVLSGPPFVEVTSVCDTRPTLETRSLTL